MLTAYDCFVAFLERAGHVRQERLTPYEFLYSLPDRFSFLSDPAGVITGVYVGTAYSSDETTAGDSKKVLDALLKLKSLLESKNMERVA
ncbi:MAG: DUF4129 domain-containing protein [bacterium]|nr:DUF4129 domain-containing protein [bacterium]